VTFSVTTRVRDNATLQLPTMTSALTNPAHEPGYTSLAFSPDGKWAYTGGAADTLVRVWRTDQGADQEPEISTDAMEGITSLSASKGAWLSGSEDGDVRSYVAGESSMDGMVTSAVGVAIRCVAIDPMGKRVAVTSE
jgi:chromosome transmission fidelity protein 4